MSLNFSRYMMVSHGRVLAGRGAGRVAGDEVQHALEEGGALVLSFRDVEVASPSFLDELVLGVRRALIGGDARRWLIVQDLQSEDVREALEMVLDRHKLSFAEMNITDNGDRHVQLLGGATHLQATLAAAQELGSFRVPQLAAELGVKVPALHQRLQALMEGGVITRQPDPAPARGGAHVYSALGGRSLPPLVLSSGADDDAPIS